jgi:hypothetical protein
MGCGEVFVITWVSAGILVVIRRQVRKRQFVREWAQRRGYTIVKRLPAWYRLSPFPLAEIASKQSIHHLLIRDKQGVERRCWLRVGDWFVGHLSDEVAVAWEGAAPEDWDPTER